MTLAEKLIKELPKAVTRYDIKIRANDICCEYHDGDMFGGKA